MELSLKCTSDMVILFIAVTWMTTRAIRAEENPNEWSEWTEQTSCDGHRELVVKSRKCNSRSSLTIQEQLCSCEKGNTIDRSDNSRTQQCLQPTIVPISTSRICSGKFIKWLPPVPSKRFANRILAANRQSNMSSCRELCLQTEGCQGANLYSSGICEIMSSKNVSAVHNDSTALTYECCKQESRECKTPIVNEKKPVCPSGYIYWNSPIPGSLVNSTLLSMKFLENVSSCQDYCYSTPHCAAAILRKNGECLAMGGTTPILQHKEMTLLTYSCCPKVNGLWSSWSQFSSCDLRTGLMVRFRQCNAPVPSGGGAQCEGDAVESQECRANGSWSTWSSYSACSNQTGLRIRTRQCNNPRPSGGGAPCVGSSVETIICGGGSFKSLPGRFRRFKQPFVSRKKTVSSRDDCIKICLNKILNSKCEVFQIEYESASPNKFRCRTSSLRASYLPVFAKRYLESDPDYDAEDEWNTYYEIYYLNVASDFKEHQLPELFYPLDDISKNVNIGKLDSSKYAMNMGTSPQHFECDFAFAQSKFLTLIPSDNYRLYIPEVSSIPFNASSHLTISVWIKKRVAEGPVAPILEGTSKANTIGEWFLWNHDTPNKLHPLWGRNKALISPSLNGRSWNYIVMRINSNIMELFVNNQLEGSVSVSGSIRSLGDYISIGRRIGNPAGWGASGHVFDGCIGHLMLFTRSISDTEIIQFGRLTLDEYF